MKLPVIAPASALMFAAHRRPRLPDRLDGSMTADEARITAAIATLVDDTAAEIVSCARFMGRVSAQRGHDFHDGVRELLVEMLRRIQKIGVER